jgi:Fe-S oxidoreductase
VARKKVKISDIGKETEKLDRVPNAELMPIDADWEEPPWTPLSEQTNKAYACLLDDTQVLPIPHPKGREEEDALVEQFLTGVQKLFERNNNWTFLSQLETTIDYCAQCNTCADACHLYEASGRNEMYRPAFRSEIFRRLYKKYVRKDLLSAWRNGEIELNWRTVARLGEMAYRCNLCRRCAQTCPIGADNGLLSREIRKVFSQEMGIAVPELHENGSMLQMKVGSSTGMNDRVVKDNLEFIDEDFSDQTGYAFKTPWDVKGADILLIHNAGEILSWPENIAAFSIIFQAAGLSWTMSSDIAGYDNINYGVFYDDVQLARTAILHAQAARKLGVKKIVLGECGHAHKSLVVIADRVIPEELRVQRESCFPLLRDIVFSGKIKFDPERNNFPVTLHDPCNLVRLMGIVEPQREILRRLCPQFREMTPHGVHNYCCGGGSGFAVISRGNFKEWRLKVAGRKKLTQILRAFSDCRGSDHPKYVCAPCSNCKGQIRDLISYYQLRQREKLIYAGLAELIVNAMADVKPGFIRWDEE